MLVAFAESIDEIFPIRPESSWNIFSLEESASRFVIVAFVITALSAVNKLMSAESAFKLGT